jgi:predicted AlkP superfamily phosphohydrolase/phosphomutase
LETASRVLVLGLDGGNLEIFRQYAQQGHMPFLAGVFERGTTGPLKSVIPPVTPPAWSTFMTGKNPGQHNIFDFSEYVNCNRPLQVVNSTKLRSETLWSMLSRAGKRVGVVNVPMTYPPQPVNGVMMTDLLTPSTEQTFTYPDTLYQELRPQLGDYIIAVIWREYSRRRVDAYLRDLETCTRQRARYVMHLMDRDPSWDFFMVVFSEIDHLQHGLWSFLDPQDGREHDPRVEALLAGYFRMLDGLLEQLCAKAGPQAQVYFVSDHGFGPVYNWLHINTWLQEQGLLAFKPGPLKALRRRRALRDLMKRLDPYNWRKLFRGRGGKISDILGIIDWGRTQAFAASSSDQGIRINLQGREELGTVAPEDYERVRDQIIARLRELRDPETGELVATDIYKREEVFSGPSLERAADIIFICRDGEYVGDAFPARRLIEKTDWTRGMGTHRLHGMFMAFGPGIRRGAQIRDAHLQDMTPTLLYALRQPIPNDLDGRVLQEVFEERIQSANQPKFIAPERQERSAAAPVYSADEEQLVLERLRGLGYID